MNFMIFVIFITEIGIVKDSDLGSELSTKSIKSYSSELSNSGQVNVNMS